MSNLLPSQEIKKIEHLYQKRLVVLILIVLMIMSIIATGCLFYAYRLSKHEESALLYKKADYEKKEIGKLKRDLVSTIKDMNTRLNSFKLTSFHSPVVGSFIDAITKSKTSAITLSNFNYVLNSDGNTAKVSIFGISSNRESILEYADKLRKTPGISDVNVPITNFIKESNMPFSITVVVALK
jgi:hypothetical protein